MIYLIAYAVIGFIVALGCGVKSVYDSQGCGSNSSDDDFLLAAVCGVVGVTWPVFLTIWLFSLLLKYIAKRFFSFE